MGLAQCMDNIFLQMRGLKISKAKGPPWMFFAIHCGVPLQSMVSDSSGERNTTTATRTCSSPVSYTGSVCRDELFSMTECFPDNSLTSDLLVVTDASTEQETLSIIRSLELFGSPECVAAATPFLCVHLFDGVCDSEGVLYLPTREECEELSTDVCRTEFELAHSIGMEFVDCEQLPTESPPLCTDSSQGFGNGAFVEPSADENGKLVVHCMDIVTANAARNCSCMSACFIFHELLVYKPSV